MPEPVLSIVIPSYNSERFITECLESLLRERSEEVEYIAVDGASTDGTLSILEKYSDMFTHIISEKDSGQSEAFNKGFNLAKGRYLTWLNSDDVLCPGSLNGVLAELKQARYEWYAANSIHIDANSAVIKCCKSGRFEKWALKWGVLSVFGPSTLFSRKLFDQFGGFREDFHYCMDTEYWWRLAAAGIHYKRIPVYLWALRLHEDAKTASTFMLGADFRPAGMKAEGRQFQELHFPEVSTGKLKSGITLARLFRIATLSYPKAWFATKRFQGQSIDSVNCTA